LKLHDLKTLSPEEAQERIKDLREQIKTMNFFAAHGAVNIAQLYRVKQEVRKIGGKEEEVPVGIMVEWCTLGDAEWITLDPPRPGTKEYTTCVRIAYDIAMGLASIHADPINYVHGDIKPANFLLTSLKGKISGRIGDLGSCVKAGQKTTSLSKAYSAPEMLLGSKKHIATTQSDAWSFGVALLEMFHGQDSNEFAKISSPGKWKEALAAIKVHVNPNDPIDALILDCFQAPQRRPTLQQAADRLLAVLLKSSGESSADVGRRAPEASPTGETSKGIAGSVNIAPQKILPHVQPTKKPLSQKVQAQIEALEHQWALDWKLKATRQ
jgi:serine/threonine protein kinase